MSLLASIIEAKREPLAAARIQLEIAEADLNGIISAMSAGVHRYSFNDATTRSVLTLATDRVNDARHALDEARFNALGVHLSGNRSLCTNDRDDMLDALITRLEQNDCGFAPSVNAPLHAADIARAESALIERAHDRGAAVSQISEAA